MPETTSSRLKFIMEQRGLKQIDILRLSEPYCEKYKVKLGKSDLSQFINGKVVPGQWKLTILGLALNVSEGWLMGLDVPITRNFCTCPICGMDYLSTVESEIEEHNYFHELFCCAVNKYGFCYPRDSLGIKKSKAYDILYSTTAIFDEKCSASEEILKIYFSRSVAQNNYNLEHPQFIDYAAMLLDQDQFKGRFGSGIYDVLVQKYGRKPGIPEGETTYKIKEIRDILQGKGSKPTEFPSYSSDAMKLAADFDFLDKHGQKVVCFVTSEEVSRCKKLAKEKKQSELKEHTSPVVTLKQPYTQVAAAEGSGAFLLDDGCEEVSVTLNQFTQQADVILKVVGRSMEPTISDGDRVLVRVQPSVNLGEIGVFIIDGQGYLKERASDRLVSLNSNIEDVFLGDLQQAECYGKFISVLDPEWVK